MAVKKVDQRLMVMTRLIDMQRLMVMTKVYQRLLAQKNSNSNCSNLNSVSNCAVPDESEYTETNDDDKRSSEVDDSIMVMCKEGIIKPVLLFVR